MTPDQRLIATAIGWLLAVIGLVGAGMAVGYQWRDRGAKAELAELKREQAVERQRLASAQTREVEKARTEERRAAFRIQETVDAGHIKLQSVEAAARRAAVESRSLRADLAAYRDAYHAIAASDSATAEECRTAASAASVCADLLGQCSEERREIAEFADRSATAGAVCAGAYRALIVPRLGGPGG
jgi:hypothetical protein